MPLRFLTLQGGESFIALETPREDPASLRPLQALGPAQQVEQLMAWLSAMAGQIPDAAGLTPGQRADKQSSKNTAVLVV